MDRRPFLATVGSALLAGCAGVATTPGNRSETRNGGPNSSNDDDPIVRRDVDETPSLGLYEIEFGLESATGAEPATVVQFGTGEDTHWVTLMAESDGAVETTVAVRRDAASAPFFEASLDVSSSRYAGFLFRRSDDYAIEVETENASDVVEVGAERIDCNWSTQALLLAENGDLETTAISETMACGSSS